MYGLVSAVFALFFGYIAKYTGRFPMIIFILCISMGISLFVITWTVNPNVKFVLFLVYIAFAIAHSTSNGTIRSNQS